MPSSLDSRKGSLEITVLVQFTPNFLNINSRHFLTILFRLTLAVAITLAPLFTPIRAFFTGLSVPVVVPVAKP
jgi:hypothetical protein